MKKSEILENASKIDTVIFDKTGTITYGMLKISEIINYSDMENDEIIKIAGSVEAKSTHPISKAFADYMTENKIIPYNIDEFENISGYGIVGNIENKKYIIGNSKIIDKYDIANDHKDDELRLSKGGNSIVYIAKDNKIIAMIGVNDIVRENVRDVISRLNKRNIATIMLTGDNEETAGNVGKQIGITEVIANVLPTDKANEIKKLKKENHRVMMCGDGINDSPALANADIGVSVQSGTDIAMDASDVILTKNDLNSVLQLIQISEKTVRNIKQNLFWAFFYNVLMIPIAMGIFKFAGIFINPMIASLAMMFSSLTVILNALRLKRMKI